MSGNLMVCLLAGSLGLPDLQVSNVYLAPTTNEIKIVVENVGADVMTAGADVALYVDHLLIETNAFSALDADESTTISTGQYISGLDRRVLVRVDPADDITEENEFQNYMAFTIDPPSLGGCDLELSAGVDGSGEYWIVKNVGPTTCSNGLQLDFIDENNGDNAITESLSAALASGQSETIRPSEAVADDMRVRFTATGEKDSTNNYVDSEYAHVTASNISSWYGNYYITYEDDLTFSYDEGTLTTVSYDGWPAGMDARLDAMLLLLEQGQRIDISEPIWRPWTYGCCRTRTANFDLADAKEIYLAWVAQSLWWDRNDSSWALSSQTSAQRRWYFNSLRFPIFPGGSGHYDMVEPSAYDPQIDTGWGISWNPQYVYDFMRHLGWLDGTITHKSVVFDFVDWRRMHSRHGTYTGWRGYSAQEYGSAAYGAHVDRLLYPLATGQNDYTSWGCWWDCATTQSFMRVVNIPHEPMYNDFNFGSQTSSMHCGMQWPTIRITGASSDRAVLPHMDDCFTSVNRPWGTAGWTSTEDMFMDDDEAYDLLEDTSMALQDHPEGGSHTLSEQRDWNYESWHLNNACVDPSGGLVETYDGSGHVATDLLLQGHRLGFFTFATDMVTPANREACLTACAAETGADHDRLYANMEYNRRIHPYDPDKLYIKDWMFPVGKEDAVYVGGNVRAINATGLTWSKVGGTLPTGLTFADVGDVGVISGTPAADGEFTINVQVTDGTDTVNKWMPLYISNDATFRLVEEFLPPGRAGEYYSASVCAKGGVSPYTWSRIWYWPQWLSLTTGTPCATLTGLIPLADGDRYSFTVEVVDDDTPQGTKSHVFSLTVYENCSELTLGCPEDEQECDADGSCRWCVLDPNRDGVIDDDDLLFFESCKGSCYDCVGDYYQTPDPSDYDANVCCVVNWDEDSGGCVQDDDEYIGFAGCFSELATLDDCANCQGPSGSPLEWSVTAECHDEDTDYGCSGAKSACKESTGQCKQCTEDSDCGKGYPCIFNICNGSGGS